MQRATFGLFMGLTISAAFGLTVSPAAARGRAWKPVFAPPEDNLERLHRNLSEDHRAAIEHAEALKDELAGAGWMMDRTAARARL